MTFTRITANPNQMSGAFCVRGLRIPVATVLSKLAAGLSVPELLNAYPDLEAADVMECLEFAAEALSERRIPLVA